MPSRYVSMRKISLKRECRDRLEAEYNLRRHSPSAIVFDFPLGKYPAFVMLTPQLHALIVKLYKDSALLSDLQTHALPGIAKQWYIRKILVDEIKLTNDIENVQSTRPEVKAAVDSVEGDAASRYIRFSGMAMKYASVITHSVDILRTCGDVRRLYDEFVEREVVEEDLRDTIDGQIFRSGPVYIQDSHGRVIHEGAYPESAIINQMEKALGILNDDDVDSLVRIAVFHYLFGYIHPFYNGNGRLSRYISSMMLSKELSTLAGLRLSFVIKDRKRQYDNSFKEANDPRGMGDLTDFVSAFLGFIENSMRDMIETLQMGKGAIQHIENSINRTPEFAGHEKVVEILALNGLFSEDLMSLDELKQYAGCGRPAVQKALEALRRQGLLTQRKQGRKYVYTIESDQWERYAVHMEDE